MMATELISALGSNGRLKVWKIKCEGCGKLVSLGPGSVKAMRRLIALVGASCETCSSEEVPNE